MPDHAPYIDEKTAELSRKINDRDAEIIELKKAVAKLEKEKEKAQAKAVSNGASNSGADTGASASESPKQAVDKASAGQTFEATYYSAFCPTCGEWGGVTALGDDISDTIYVQGKRVVAVDPNVIPLGSTVRVTTPNGTFDAVARDTGGDIKGKRVDILVNSTEEAYRLGRHNVKVSILK